MSVLNRRQPAAMRVPFLLLPGCVTLGPTRPHPCGGGGVLTLRQAPQTGSVAFSLRLLIDRVLRGGFVRWPGQPGREDGGDGA